MSWVATAIIGIGTAVNVAGQVKAGDAAEDQAEADAKWLRRRAGVRRAESQREAIRERHISDLVQSRAQALAAASGAGASDPTVTNILADIDAEGEYRALSRLFAGEDEAQGLEYDAATGATAGRAANRSARLGAVSSIFGAAYGINNRRPQKKGSGFYGPPP